MIFLFGILSIPFFIVLSVLFIVVGKTDPVVGYSVGERIIGFFQFATCLIALGLAHAGAMYWLNDVGVVNNAGLLYGPSQK